MSPDPIEQFGAMPPGTEYRERPSAFGLCRRADGLIATVRITREDGSLDYDLPGGALDPGEDEIAALVREFREETGLAVTAGAAVGRANQFMPNHATGPVNNLCAFYEIEGFREDGPVMEPDHALVWQTPEDAAGMMYKGAAAWAIERWLAER